MAAAKKVDYAAIEPGWRAGILSFQQLADEYTARTGISVTRNAIKKHFTALGIPRDLSAKIKSKADEIVNGSMVPGVMVPGKVPTGTLRADVEIIDANAQGQALVRIGQRQDIRRFRALVNRLLDECEATTADAPAFGELADLVRKSDGNPRANAMLAGAIDRAVSLGDRIDGVKKLSEALRILIGLEREAYGIEAGMGSGSPLEAMGNWLKSAQGASIPVMPLAIEIGD